MKPGALRCALLLLLLALSGCASMGRGSTPGDPFEGMNRAMFAFNEKADALVVRPVADGYRKVMPELVRAGVGNFFGNLADVWSAANHLLQGKLDTATEMTMRVAINSTLGLGGVLDVASEAQLPRRSEDFGQTLGRWGLAPGPFLVLPLYGPSSARDLVGRLGDQAAWPPRHLWQESSDFSALTWLDLLHTRSVLLSASRALDDAALDKYILVRDGFLARRRNLVYDGDPPEEGSGTR